MVQSATIFGNKKKHSGILFGNKIIFSLSTWFNFILKKVYFTCLLLIDRFMKDFAHFKAKNEEDGNYFKSNLIYINNWPYSINPKKDWFVIAGKRAKFEVWVRENEADF